MVFFLRKSRISRNASRISSKRIKTTNPTTYEPVVKGGGVGEGAGEKELAGDAEEEGDEEGDIEEDVGTGELDVVGAEDGRGVVTGVVGEDVGEVELAGDPEGDGDKESKGEEDGNGGGVVDGEGNGVGDGVIAGGVMVGWGLEAVQIAVAVLAALMVMELLVMLAPDASPVQPLNVYCVPASATDATDTWAYAVVPASYQPVPNAVACVETTVRCHCSFQLKKTV
jgi:hypothetical protein